MGLNELYLRSLDGGKIEEENFFSSIAERFQLVAELKILNESDRQEVVQNALMVVLRKYREMSFEISFSAWAYDILQKEILKYYRTKGDRARRYSEDVDAYYNAGIKSIDPALKRDLLDCLGKICRFNQRFARVLNLKYQGFDVDEICRRLEVNISNLYVILSRARSKLKLCLEKGIVE
ncbi:MAG: sigma-70 family RNA polymerase sigma factor [Candidatus Zixiibacteriota bacterium]